MGSSLYLEPGLIRGVALDLYKELGKLTFAFDRLYGSHVRTVRMEGYLSAEIWIPGGTKVLILIVVRFDPDK